MTHKHSLGALYKILKDIKQHDKLFGSFQVIQALSTFDDDINACLKSMRMWRNVEKYTIQSYNSWW